MAFFRKEQTETTSSGSTNTKPKEVLKNPSDKKFFGLHFTGDLNTKYLGIAGQVLSAITEFIAIANLVGYSSPFFQSSNILALTIGAIAVYVFEILGVRVYLVSVVRVIANWKEKDEDGNTIKKKTEAKVLFALNLLLLLCIMFLNMKSSMMGESSIFFEKKNESKHNEVFALNEERNAKILAIESEHSGKITENLTAYENSKSEVLNAYNFDVKTEKERNKTAVKSLEKSKWNSKAKEYFDKLINTENQTNGTNLQALKTSKEDELQRLDSKYKIDDSGKHSIITQINQSYDHKIQSIETKTQKANNFWAFVDGGAMFLLIIFIVISWVAIIYDEIFKSGSEMEIHIEEINVNPSLVELLFERLNHWAYHLGFLIITGIMGTKKYNYDDPRESTEKYTRKARKKRNFSKLNPFKQEEQEEQLAIGYRNKITISNCDTDTLQRNEKRNETDSFWAKHTRNKIRNYYNRGVLGKSSSGVKVGEKSKKDNLIKYQNIKAEAKIHGIDIDKELKFK